MNEEMQLAWLEISQMLGEPTREELDVFLRTWQRAIQAERHSWPAEMEAMERQVNILTDALAQEREACAKLCEELLERPSGYQGTWEGYGKFKTQMTGQECAAAIRARKTP